MPEGLPFVYTADVSAIAHKSRDLCFDCVSIVIQRAVKIEALSRNSGQRPEPPAIRQCLLIRYFSISRYSVMRETPSSRAACDTLSPVLHSALTIAFFSAVSRHCSSGTICRRLKRLSSPRSCGVIRRPYTSEARVGRCSSFRARCLANHGAAWRALLHRKIR